MRTYATAFSVDTATDAALTAYAALFTRVEHTLHADLERSIARGSPLTCHAFKNDYVKRFGITSRQFNAIRVTLDGKRDAIKALNKERAYELAGKLKKLKQKLDKLKARRGNCSGTLYQVLGQRISQLHDKLERLTAKLVRLKADNAAGRVRLAFGSKKLLNAQHHLEENGFKNHAEWRADWTEARSRQFVCVGSKSETAGNQTCVAQRQDNGTLALRLRLPNGLVVDGMKHVELPAITFNYGLADIETTLDAGRAITYRFTRKTPGNWQVVATIEIEREITPVTLEGIGCLGVDFNSGFILVTETDHYGNKLVARRLNTPEAGMSADQRDAARGEAVKVLLAWAKRTSKPIVLEDLDLERKKRGRGNDETHRKVSALAYRALRDRIEARAFDQGVEVLIKNPAYSSVQGRLLAVENGLSVHGGAALVLARRGQGYSERVPKASSRHRLAASGHVLQWRAPARMPAGGEVAAWRCVSASIQQALAAHYRGLSQAQPSWPATGDLCAAVISGGNPELNGDGDI